MHHCDARDIRTVKALLCGLGLGVPHNDTAVFGGRHERLACIFNMIFVKIKQKGDVHSPSGAQQPTVDDACVCMGRSIT